MPRYYFVFFISCFPLSPFQLCGEEDNFPVHKVDISGWEVELERRGTSLEVIKSYYSEIFTILESVNEKGTISDSELDLLHSFIKENNDFLKEFMGPRLKGDRELSFEMLVKLAAYLSPDFKRLLHHEIRSKRCREESLAEAFTLKLIDEDNIVIELLKYTAITALKSAGNLFYEENLKDPLFVYFAAMRGLDYIRNAILQDNTAQFSEIISGCAKGLRDAVAMKTVGVGIDFSKWVMGVNYTLPKDFFALFHSNYIFAGMHGLKEKDVLFFSFILTVVMYIPLDSGRRKIIIKQCKELFEEASELAAPSKDLPTVIRNEAYHARG